MRKASSRRSKSRAGVVATVREAVDNDFAAENSTSKPKGLLSVMNKQ